jgi:hypothetical protein
MTDKDVLKTGITRRGFITGGVAAGISAIAVSYAPKAVADTSGGDQIKLVCAIYRRPDLSKEEFYDYWLNSHGPFATQLVRQLGAIRYVQSHTIQTGLNTLIRTSRGQVNCPYDGVTEVWFSSKSELVETLATPEGIEANLKLIEDESHFINLQWS